jgi:hypothetical protein
MENTLQGGFTQQSISPVAWRVGSRSLGDLDWWVEMEIVNSAILFALFCTYSQHSRRLHLCPPYLICTLFI